MAGLAGSSALVGWADSAEIELLGVMIRQKGDAMENAEVEIKGVKIEVGVDVSRSSLGGRMTCKHRAKHGKSVVHFHKEQNMCT